MNTICSNSNQHFSSADEGFNQDVTAVSIELDFHFEYGQQIYKPLPIIADYCGPIPRSQEIVIFGDAEGFVLALAGLPIEVWQVHQVICELLEDATQRVSVALVNVTSEYQRGGSLIH